MVQEFSVCVTEDGVLASFSGATNTGEQASIEMVAFSDTVDPAAFEPPAGASDRRCHRDPVTPEALVRLHAPAAGPPRLHSFERLSPNGLTPGPAASACARWTCRHLTRPGMPPADTPAISGTCADRLAPGQVVLVRRRVARGQLRVRRPAAPPSPASRPADSSRLHAAVARGQVR